MVSRFLKAAIPLFARAASLLAVSMVFAGSLPLSAKLDEDTFSAKLRILPLGDSITEAGANASYRYPLWRRLLEHGVDPDFLGSKNDGLALNSPDRPPRYRGRAYDGDHEGHWGWTTDEVLTELEGWLARYAVPDIALVHLGTNDVFRNQPNSQTIEELRGVIACLRERNPEMIIVVAKIFPGTWGNVSTFNTEIDKLLDEDILIADCFTPIDLSTDSDDGAHPNASGGEKMAEAWWSVLQPHLEHWRQSYARWEQGFGISLPESGDADLDGWNNDLEFVARSDPLDRGSGPSFTWQPDKLLTPFDPLRFSGRYRLEKSPSPFGPFTVVEAADIETGTEGGTPIPANGEPLFVRLVDSGD